MVSECLIDSFKKIENLILNKGLKVWVLTESLTSFVILGHNLPDLIYFSDKNNGFFKNSFCAPIEMFVSFYNFYL